MTSSEKTLCKLSDLFAATGERVIIIDNWSNSGLKLAADIYKASKEFTAAYEDWLYEKAFEENENDVV